MAANNEIGTIQPIREIAKLVRHARKNTAEKEGNKYGILFHTDASQAAQYCDLNVLSLGVDFLTLDSSKLYAPKGTGMAYIKRGIAIEPLIFGGAQEKGLRAGTENVFGIVALAEALKIAEKQKIKEGKRQAILRDYAIAEILKKFPTASLNGDPQNRLPNNINICFPNFDAEYAIFRLDVRGVACSSVTSCKNLSEDSSSYVIEALGRPDCAKSSLRFTLGRQTTKSDIKQLVDYLYKMI
jgi:cysteine desulfurase